MKRTTLSVIFLLLVHLLVTAQSGFRPGYIIRNNGDTINGQVFYSADSKFEKICQFRRFEIAHGIAYGPDEIVAFGFRNGRHFESKNSGDRNKFYECIIKSIISLYIIPGKISGQLFIDHASTGFIRLNMGQNLAGEGERFSNFRELLSWLLNKSGSVTPVNETEYNVASITSLIRRSAEGSSAPVREFHLTTGVNRLADFTVSRPGSRWSIGITGGYQFLTLTIPGNNLYLYFKEAEYNPSYRPAAGIFINRKISRRSELASIDIAFLYLADSFYGYAEYTTVSDCRDDIFIDFTAIQVPLSLKFQFGKKRFHPFVKAGMFGSIQLSNSFNRFSERQYESEIFTDNYSDFYLRNDFGFQGSVGMEILAGQGRRLSVEAGYMQGNQKLIYTNTAYSTVIKTRIFSLMFRIGL
jgi:hypothetical protein